MLKNVLFVQRLFAEKVSKLKEFHHIPSFFPIANRRVASGLDVEPERKIRENTRISRQHVTPEIALHLITPECEIYHESITEDFVFDKDPFWGFYWPGGQAVTRYILDNPHTFSKKSVLDLGCGCGASSIAAKMIGATKVVANDIDETALVASQMNARLNSVEIETNSINLLNANENLDDFDVILVGDLFYDEEISQSLTVWLKRLKTRPRHQMRMILIGDPGRHAFNQDKTGKLNLLAKYQLPENCCIENNGFRHAFVWQL